MRSWKIAIAVVGSLVAAYAVIAVSGWVSATPTLAQAAPLPGMASVSGMVDSTTPVKAAQVFIRNVDKRILYMVYTNAGQFRAVPLFPGNYEVSVSANGLQSDVQKVVLKAGENPKLKLSVRSTAGDSQRTVVNALETETSTNSTTRVEQSYDEIYPPGKGRDVAERTCINCHGENFLPTRPADASVWTARIDRMMGTALAERPAASYAEGLLTLSGLGLAFLTARPGRRAGVLGQELRARCEASRSPDRPGDAAGRSEARQGHVHGVLPDAGSAGPGNERPGIQQVEGGVCRQTRRSGRAFRSGWQCVADRPRLSQPVGQTGSAFGRAEGVRAPESDQRQP